MMEILRIEELLETLKRGGIILHPNDTVWGLACNAFNENSVHRLRQLKRRPEEKPFILLASSLEMVKKYVANIHPRVETLLQYHQRPLTVIYEQVSELPDYLLTEEKQAAIRVSLDPFTQSLINKLGNPIISTSANYTSEPYPLRFEDIDKDIIKEVDAVYHGIHRSASENQPSVVVRFTRKGDLIFLRE